MSRSTPDVRFSLGRWEEEMGHYWSVPAAAGKGLRYVAYKELERRKRFGLQFLVNLLSRRLTRQIQM